MMKLIFISIITAGIILATAFGIRFIVKQGGQGTISESRQVEPSQIEIIEPVNKPISNQEESRVVEEPESKLIYPGWVIYKNETFKFALQHPKEWQNEEYGPFQTGRPLHETLFVYPKEQPERNVWLAMSIWDLSTPDSEIISKSMAGLRFVKENDLTLGGFPAKEKVYFEPSQATGGMHYYRLYLVRNEDYAFSITSSLCNDEKKPDCDKILATIEFLR